VRGGDFVGALPILKKIAADDESTYSDLIKTTLLDVYYFSRRYEKADALIQDYIKNKMISDMPHDFQVRAGDIMFFLKRYQDAAEWYPTVLKPSSDLSDSENLSWLYLAESVYRTGNKETSKKIFKAMLPYYEKSLYKFAIQYRLTDSMEQKQRLIQSTNNKMMQDWFKTEMLVDSFEMNPYVFTSKNLQTYLDDLGMDEDLKQQILLLQGYVYLLEKQYYKAAENLRSIELSSKNSYIAKAIDDIIIDIVIKQSDLNKTSEEALSYLRFINSYHFSFRTINPQILYSILWKNFKLIGLEEASGEVVLHIIDKTVHTPTDKAKIYLKFSEELQVASNYRQSRKISEQISTDLLSFEDREKYNRINTENLLRLKRTRDAIEFLDEWRKQGTSAINTYWTTLKKVEILFEEKSYSEAL
jgi:hypothetical protein